MSSQSDVFELGPNDMLPDVKARVKNWLGSPMGHEYVLEPKSERYVILTRTKHDWKVCGITCVLLCLSPFALVGMILMGMGMSYGMFYALVIGYVASVFLCMIGGTAWFCLKPRKAVYELRFSEEMPLRVAAYISGALLGEDARQEYMSLKEAIIGHSIDGGAGLA